MNSKQLSPSMVRTDLYSYAGIIREYRASIDFDSVANNLKRLADCIDTSDKDARITDLLAERDRYKAPLEQFMRQWESDIQFYNGLDGDDLASWAELFRKALERRP